MAIFLTHHMREYAYVSHNARKFSFTLGKMLNTLHILVGSTVIAIGIRGIEYITNKQVREETSQKHLLSVLKYFALVSAALYIVSMIVPTNQFSQHGGSELALQAAEPVIPQPSKLPLLEDAALLQGHIASDLQHDICRAVTPKPVPTIVDP